MLLQASVGKLTDDTEKTAGAIYVKYVKKAVEKVRRSCQLFPKFTQM